MAEREHTTRTASQVPAWAAPVLYTVLALVLFHEFVFSREMLFGTDTVAAGYFARKFFADFVRATGEFPMWNPMIFGGMPFVDAMHGDIFYPTTLLSFVLPVYRALGWKLVIHIALAGVFAHLWLRQLAVSRPAALWGGAAYVLAPVLVSLVYPGHDGKLFVTALTPLLFWATDRAVRDARISDVGVLALVVALVIFTAHLQLGYFAVWGAIGWALWRLFGWRGVAAILPVLILLAILRAWPGGLAGITTATLLILGSVVALALRRPALRRPLKRFALFAVGGVLGAMIAAIQLWTPACYLGGAPRAMCGDYHGYSRRVATTTEAGAQRGFAYSASWSLHPEEVVSLVIPEFVGENISTRSGRVDTYWGRNFFKLNHEYVGVLGLFLAPIVFLRRRRGGGRSHDGAFFIGLGILTLLYALGATTPAFRAFYALVPGVNLFRAPSSIMFLFALAVTTLGALALDEIAERAGDPVFRRTLERYCIGLALAFGLLALLGSAGRLLPDLWIGIVYPEIPPEKMEALEANLGNIRRGLWITFGLAAATAGLIWAYARGRMRTLGLVFGILLLGIFDEWRVSARFITTVSPTALFPHDEAIAYLQEQSTQHDPFRVLSLTPDDNLPALHGLEQVRGHHPNDIGRYRSLIEGNRLIADEFRMLKLLNAEFVLSPQAIQAPGWEPVGRGRRYALYRLPGSLPRAFLVSRYEVLPDSLALERLFAPDFDPTSTVVLADPLPESLRPQEGATGSVRWLSREVNRQSLEVEASAPALLVISENYYPAWRVHVNDTPVRLRRADLSLRAIPIPEGRHRVDLVYRSGLFIGSLWLSLLAAALACGLIAGSHVTERRRARLTRPAGEVSRRAG